MTPLVIGSLVVLATLAVVGFGPAALEAVRSRRRRRRPRPRPRTFDPGRERRAEMRARQLLRATVGEENFAMYVQLGFLRVLAGADERGEPTHGYLIYPHRPIVSYDPATGELLSEHCVHFLDRSEPGYGDRLPPADDVFAKWASLHGDERGLIADANVHLPGRQVDPGQVRRDLRRLRDWEGSRRASERASRVAAHAAVGEAR